MVAPALERARHGAVEHLARPTAHDAGGVTRPYRAIDVLAAMERRGSITVAMRVAGEDFRRHFQTAHLDSLHAAGLERAATAARSSSSSDDVASARVYKGTSSVSSGRSRHGR